MVKGSLSKAKAPKETKEGKVKKVKDPDAPKVRAARRCG